MKSTDVMVLAMLRKGSEQSINSGYRARILRSNRRGDHKVIFPDAMMTILAGNYIRYSTLKFNKNLSASSSHAPTQ